MISILSPFALARSYGGLITKQFDSCNVLVKELSCSFFNETIFFDLLQIHFLSLNAFLNH